MHYAVYLDEFGHIGPFVSRDHKKYNDSPVFGFAGMVLPVEQVREFAIWFYKQKCDLLKYELKNNNPAQVPPYQWEKKGSQLYTVLNITKYRQLRQSTNRILNKIAEVGGHVFYTGVHKTLSSEDHDSAKLFNQQLLQTIRKIDKFCVEKQSTFMVLLDEQQAGEDWRLNNVEACTLAMFEDKTQKCRTLIEPPLQGESHLYQTLQCADWICGLVNRLMACAVVPDEYDDWKIFTTYFGGRVAEASMACSGLEKELPPAVPATPEVLLDGTTELKCDIDSSDSPT